MSTGIHHLFRTRLDRNRLHAARISLSRKGAHLPASGTLRIQRNTGPQLKRNSHNGEPTSFDKLELTPTILPIAVPCWHFKAQIEPMAPPGKSTAAGLLIANHSAAVIQKSEEIMQDVDLASLQGFLK